MEDRRDSADLDVHPLQFEELEGLSPRPLCSDHHHPPPDDDDDDHVGNSSSSSSKYFSVVMGINQRRERRRSRINVCRRHWQQAVIKARSMADPWEHFHLENYPAESIIRYRYNALTKAWVTDDIIVKMETLPFGHGAMRNCLRLKKLSPNFCHSNKWKTANNYVAKRYMDDVERQVYFDDVRLQMDAKLWGEEFNRHNPPKKVDMMQVSVVEFINRENKPLYHLEHFIEGSYIKYNSNSGYVADKNARQTPQAFSHFTFERSGHELLVVDIQGVGDLYTDPQIHTASGKEYNDGNLGTRGMALFFQSHCCNSICESLGLSTFDLALSETKAIKHSLLLRQCSDTHIRGTEELCITPGEHDGVDWHDMIRPRSESLSSQESTQRRRNSSTSSEGNYSSIDSGFDTQRERYVSESGSLTNETDKLVFHEMVVRKSRPSCVQHEVSYRLTVNSSNRTGGSILGQVHLDLAKYHELCRFNMPGDDNYDKDAALYHLRHAADCGTLEAIICMARIYLQLPHDILVDLQVPETEENENIGIDYLVIAAEAGDRASMLQIAKAYDTGLNLGTERQRSWKEATRWYSRVVDTEDVDESGHFDGCMDDPKYLILARQAEMCLNGGYGLEGNPTKSGLLFQQAATEAMEAGKGRLANKYFAMAEESFGGSEE